MVIVTYESYDSSLGRNVRPERLRSADTLTLLVSRMWTNFSDRVFSAAGPRVWNYLPTDLETAGLVIQPWFQTVAEDILFGQWDQSAV